MGRREEREGGGVREEEGKREGGMRGKREREKGE